jgi:hypothetical protein
MSTHCLLCVVKPDCCVAHSLLLRRMQISHQKGA